MGSGGEAVVHGRLCVYFSLAARNDLSCQVSARSLSVNPPAEGTVMGRVGSPSC